MLEKDIRQTQSRYEWPDNYYMETDASKRKTYLDEALSADDSGENRLRLLLWQKRYTNSHGKLDGTDYFLKQWVNLPFAVSAKASLFGGKKKEHKLINEIRDVFELRALSEHKEYEQVWYREFLNLCCFYIQLSQTDKTYSTTAFGLGKLSDDTLAQKLAADLCERTITLPVQLGISDDLALLKEAARAAYALYYPGRTGLYDTAAKKALEKTNA